MVPWTHVYSTGPLPMEASGPPSNTWFLGHTLVSPQMASRSV